MVLGCGIQFLVDYIMEFVDMFKSMWNGKGVVMLIVVVLAIVIAFSVVSEGTGGTKGGGGLADMVVIPPMRVPVPEN